jgi:ankyrin repeat protein
MRSCLQGHLEVSHYHLNRSQAWSSLCAAQVTRLLLHHSASVDAQDADGQTPLHKAALGRSGAMVRLLLDCPGADPRVADRRGATPVGLARQAGDAECQALLAAAAATSGQWTDACGSS